MKFGIILAVLCLTLLHQGESILLTKLFSALVQPKATPAPKTQTYTPVATSNSYTNKNGNLLVNGYFEEPTIKSGYKFLNSIPGWKASATLEQGIGSTYNRNWGSKVVLELDAHKNYCIDQSVALPVGNYKFELDYAARENYLKTSSLTLYLNSKQIECINAKDTNIYVLSFNIGVECAGSYNFKICGTGTSNSYGMTIGRAELVKI